MNLIICLDENNGMLFNKRRQSRDSAVIDKILNITSGAKFWMNTYSEKLFPKTAKAIIDSEYLVKAQVGDFCFAEERIETLCNVEKLYVFLWNRNYPSDVRFDFNITNEGLTLESTEEFSGTSHEKITLNIYSRT